MKKTKIIAVLTAVLCSSTFVMSVSAAELSDVTPENSTEVTAKIVNPGSISYVITIPETADFGTLTQPEDNSNPHYTFYSFQVEATELNILSNSGVGVGIWMKDADADDNQFYITQKDAENPFKISYDIYDSVVNENNIAGETALNAPSNTPGMYGYHLCTFRSSQTGATQDVTLYTTRNFLKSQAITVEILISTVH